MAATFAPMANLNQDFDNALLAAGIPENSGLLLAISGGVDSMSLLHLLCQKKYKLQVAHVHHGLRKESDAEVNLVSETCSRHKIPFHLKKVDQGFWEGKNIQIEARKIRYAFFESLLKEQNLQYIVTAHHANDALETFFLNLLRGSGIQGLSGWELLKGNRLRPLIYIQKETLIAYAQLNGISWMEDSSNLEHKYHRNQIRSKLIPVIEEIDPRNIKGLRRSIWHLEEAREALNFALNNWRAQNIVIENDDTLEINWQNPNELWFVRKVFSSIISLHPDAFEQLWFANPGAIKETPEGRLTRTRSGLVFSKIKPTEPEINLVYDDMEALLKSPFVYGTQDFESQIWEKYPDHICIDAETINFPVAIRNLKPNDQFQPLGMAGSVDAIKWLKARAISHIQKEKTLVICDQKNILAVMGIMPSQLAKISSETKIILLLSKTVFTNPI
jgi:tRNA(Ile)-lysidine synthase